MSMRNNFGVFILTHGRPDRVITYETIRSRGYTGPIYIVCDDEDKTLDEYRAKFDNVLVFSKAEVEKTFDTADNSKDRRVIIYARNVCFEFAKQLGLDYFIELDDDYTYFMYRFSYDDKGTCWDRQKNVKDLDAMFDHFIEFYKSVPRMLSVAFGQGGDYIGGFQNHAIQQGRLLKRKAMNSFICSPSRPFKFVGRINEDVNTYVSLGTLGHLFFTIMQVGLDQLQTQTNSGGMTDVYLDSGTYVKSFYTVMFSPSSVKVAPMGTAERRLHHQISWEHTVPMILSEEHKKK